ncbi:MAG: carboxynorspermidine decarboxylase [Deltaproteobacteria bacterium]|nr:MAG: carboxynorspermidine decarboxylase [Deltaproteobacteria bacterium]
MTAAVDVDAVPSPAYVVDLAALDRNLEVLDDVQRRSGARILLALKGFAMWSVFDRIGRVLAGAAASSPHEARLAREHMGKEVHAYAPAFSDASFEATLPHCDHVVFNSLAQWERFGPRARTAGISCGLRIHPGHSEVSVAIYDPCSPGSRLGVQADRFDLDRSEGLEGLHVHGLCEMGLAPLERMFAAVEASFGDFLRRVRWVNLGGGHHITRPDYDTAGLVTLLRRIADTYGVQVYLEPGEAIALGTGTLVATVLDIVETAELPVAILDTSATAHMPDVLEMPYRPEVRGAGPAGATPHTYRLGGQTCLAGDVIGDYSFPRPLAVGDRLVFEDMAHYTMVKNTTFNGVELPAICTYDPRTNITRIVRRFGYEDFAGRLS